MSLPIIKFKAGKMIIEHPTGIVQVITKPELEDQRKQLGDVIFRLMQESSDLDFQIIKL